MEAAQNDWSVYAIDTIVIGSSIGAALVGVFTPQGPGIKWWQRALSGVGCYFFAAGMLIAYQCGRVQGASLKAWAPRVLVGLTAIAMAFVSAGSEWQTRSDWARDSMVAAVYLLSADAASTEGSVIYTVNGDPAEITGRWDSAVNLAAFGVVLGALFLRRTITVCLMMGWLGAIVGAFASAHFYAWCVDSLDSEISDSQYRFISYLYRFGPYLLFHWAALVILIVTTTRTMGGPAGEPAT